MLEVRCSSLPRIVECPGVLRLENPFRSPSGEAAAVGTAVHDAICQYIRCGKEPEWMHYPGVDADEAEFLYGQTKKLWEENLRPRMLPEVECEVPLEYDSHEGWKLTGHADLLGWLAGEERRRVIVDWKTGANQVSHHYQGLGYALCDKPGPENFVFVTVWSRLGVIVTENFTFLDDVAPFSRALRETLSGELKFCPGGECCTYCPCSSRCPALSQSLEWVATQTRDIVVGEGKDPFPVERLVELRPQVEALKKAVARYDEALRAAVRNAGGKLGNLAMRGEKRVSIPLTQGALEAMEGIREGLAARVAGECAISQSAFKKVVGKGAKAALETLQNKGLTRESFVEKLCVVPDSFLIE